MLIKISFGNEYTKEVISKLIILNTPSRRIKAYNFCIREHAFLKPHPNLTKITKYPTISTAAKNKEMIFF